MIKRIGIIGLGIVGQAVLNSLKKSNRLVNRRSGLKLQIAGVCDLDKGKKKIASKYKVPFTNKAFELIDDPNIDVIVELIGGIEPANTFIIEALKRGKAVVTANKALLSKNGKQIFSLAKRSNVPIRFEASVCGAIPIIKGISEGLISCDIKKLYGIVNGTSNYILYKMEKENLDFKDALKQAKECGYAESNPTLDIEGIDTLHKLCILSYLCFGVWPKQKKVSTEGIKSISLLDILYAQELNYRIKLLAIAKRDGGGLDLRVQPTLISREHPLSDVNLAYNAVYLQGQPSGELMFYGPGAGGEATSCAVISDIVDVALGKMVSLRKEEKVILNDIRNLKSRYYIRFMACDKPGVLAHISKILAAYKISIASVTQKERGKNKVVPIIMITHEVKENSIAKALSQINKLSAIKGPAQKIRIENL